MFDFSPILNWKLLAGSHDFPGPDGGTCINEVAVVAAGFAYREITSPEDCPPCFSRVLSAYALSLNDRIPGEALRNELLMPFVARLAGSADSEAVEEARARHIVGAIVRQILPPALDRRGLFDLAFICRAAVTPGEARKAISEVVSLVRKLALRYDDIVRNFDDPLILIADTLEDLAREADLGSWGRSHVMLRVGDLPHYAGQVLDRTRGSNEGMRSSLAAAAGILAEAFEIGKKSGSISERAVASRFNKAKQEGRKRASEIHASLQAA